MLYFCSRLVLSLLLADVLLPSSLPAQGKKYALLVGVKQSGVKYAERDVEGLARTLVERCGFQRENIFSLTITKAGETLEDRWLPTAASI